MPAKRKAWTTFEFIPYSAYYPVFRSMLRNVVAALNEAQDITLYLKPLSQHFQVSKSNYVKSVDSCLLPVARPWS